jgi:hypothetical protein
MRRIFIRPSDVAFLFVIWTVVGACSSVFGHEPEAGLGAGLCRYHSRPQHSTDSSGSAGFGVPGNIARNIVSSEAPSQGAKQRETNTTKRQRGVWQSEELNILGIGMGVGDVDGDGQNEIIIVDPGKLYVYRVADNKLTKMAEYSAGSLEIKAVDVAKIRKQGPARIYVTAQNRGSIASFVLEFRNGALAPVVSDFPYYLRVINYPTYGPLLLGQQKGQRRSYEGPIYRLVDKGNELEVQERFGIPLKIPVFGFAIGDLEGKRKPLIAAYDRNDHIRVYTPGGKRLFISTDYYGGTDVILRMHGPEQKSKEGTLDDPSMGQEGYCRPRMMTTDFQGDSGQQILALTHSSRTLRILSRTKMLEEGQVLALQWNGDVLEEKWRTPKIAGMVTDFALSTLPGIGRRLIVLERKKTDWLAFLRSRSQLRAYDLESLISGAAASVGKNRQED